MTLQRAGGTSGDPLLPRPDIPEAPIDDLSEAGRERKRVEQQQARRQPGRTSKGLVIVYTGKGKGKTTAALGLLTRAWGQGLRVAMFQFIKARTGRWGEVKAARKMGLEVVPLGDGFTWMSQDLEQDRALAREGWLRCREAVLDGRYDLVVLDEITYCFKFGWLDLQEVIAALDGRPAGQHVVLTGRDAPEALLEYADLVTEMQEIKHPYRAGVRAQRGIEF